LFLIIKNRFCMFKTVVCGALALYGSRWCINQGTKHFSTLHDLEKQYNLECSRQLPALERYLTASAPFSPNATGNEYLPFTNLPTASIGSTVTEHRSFEILQLEKDGALGSYESRTADARKTLENLAGKCSVLRESIMGHFGPSVGYMVLGSVGFLLGATILFCL